MAKISGDDQSGFTGAVLVNPFVVVVRDQLDDPLEGVTVTFAVSGGSGALSATTATTDANGQAASTLTLATEPGGYTVEVGVEGVAETVTFNVVAELLEFDLSLPAGLNLIHIPLKVRAIDGIAGRIESVADLYDALGGADTVNFLITHDPATQEWFAYFGHPDNGTPADRILTDPAGILVSIKTSGLGPSRRRRAWDGRDECHPPKSRDQPCWAAVDGFADNPRQRSIRARRDRRGRRFNRYHR